jgi:hypothetical protein
VRWRKSRRIKALREQYDWIDSDRVAEAVIDLASDEREFLALVEAARIDSRDVLMWDEDRRNGVRRPQMSEERQRELIAWAGAPQEPHPTGIVDFVVTDAGADRPELLKAVRAITGLGLADAAAVLDELPAASSQVPPVRRPRSCALGSSRQGRKPSSAETTFADQDGATGRDRPPPAWAVDPQ